MTPPPRRSRLAAARDAAERGWPVFPLHPYSKCPAVKDWGQRATCDPAQISAWWAAAPYNIGIDCRSARLVVLDLDAGSDQPPPPPWAPLGVDHGRDVLRHLAARADQPDPVDTYTVATPSGGEHRYFLAPPGCDLRNTAGDTRRGLGWRVDTRAAGGFITAAGSVLRVSGGLRSYHVIRNVDPVALPDWLRTALTPAAVPTLAPIPLPAPGPRLHAYVQAALHGETTTVAQAAPGTRAHTLFCSAARLGELVGAAVLDETAAAEALLVAAAALDTPTRHSPVVKPSVTSPTASPAAATTPARYPAHPQLASDPRSGCAAPKGHGLRLSPDTALLTTTRDDRRRHRIPPRSPGRCGHPGAGCGAGGRPAGQHTGRGPAAMNLAHPPG